MRETTNYKLKMPEVGDALSIVPLNENTQIIDAALAGKVMMACGSYTGDGNLSRSIDTPGFTPQVVLMRTKGDWCDGGLEYYQSMAVKDGWCLWMGEASMTITHNPSVELNATISFNAQPGSLSWSATSTGDKASSAMNNSVSQTYQWVAFGVAQE